MSWLDDFGMFVVVSRCSVNWFWTIMPLFRTNGGTGNENLEKSVFLDDLGDNAGNPAVFVLLPIIFLNSRCSFLQRKAKIHGESDGYTTTKTWIRHKNHGGKSCIVIQWTLNKRLVTWNGIQQATNSTTIIRDILAVCNSSLCFYKNRRCAHFMYNSCS